MRAEKEAQPSFLHRLQGVVKACEILSLLFNKVPKLKKSVVIHHCEVARRTGSVLCQLELSVCVIE